MYKNLIKITNTFSNISIYLLLVFTVSSPVIGAQPDEEVIFQGKKRNVSAYESGDACVGFVMQAGQDACISPQTLSDSSSNLSVDDEDDGLDQFSPSKIGPVIHLSKKLHLTTTQAAEVLLLDSTLYMGEVYKDEDDVDLSSFTPQKATCVGFLVYQGVSTPEIRRQISEFKQTNSQPIRDITNYPRNPRCPTTPSFREVVSNRKSLIDAKKRGDLISLPPLAFKEPVKEETPEERRLRKERERMKFQATEVAILLKGDQGLLPENIAQLVSDHHRAELSLVLKPFQAYFLYIETLKESYRKGLSSKIRWPDVVGAFNRFVAPSMTRKIIDGYEVYFILDTIKFHRIHQSRGEPNHEAMSEGYSPTGCDGESMNLHHLTQLDPYVHSIKIDEETQTAQEGPYKLVLIPKCIHTEFSGSLHFDSDTYVMPQKDIDRSLFGGSREAIMKAIVAEYYKG